MAQRWLNWCSAPEAGRWQPFTCLNSLRDVEPTVNLLLDEEEVDGDVGRPWVLPVEPQAEEEGGA